LFFHYPENVLATVVKSVITQLIPHKQTNRDATRQAQGEAANIDAGVDLIVDKVADGNFEVIFPHGLDNLGIRLLPIFMPSVQLIDF